MEPWKELEAKAAKDFGGADCNRTPLSGSNSRHTESDTLHPTIFIEAKNRRSFRPLMNLFREVKSLAKKEKKVPMLVIKSPGDHGYLVAMHVDDLMEIAQCRADVLDARREREVGGAPAQDE